MCIYIYNRNRQVCGSICSKVSLELRVWVQAFILSMQFYRQPLFLFSYVVTFSVVVDAWSVASAVLVVVVAGVLVIVGALLVVISS